MLNICDYHIILEYWLFPLPLLLDAVTDAVAFVVVVVVVDVDVVVVIGW